MKKKWKILILVGLFVLIAGAVIASIRISEKGVITVQTGKVNRADLVSLVTASGEIKPRNYINIGANTAGPAPITGIFVKEGERVKRGQVLARLEGSMQRWPIPPPAKRAWERRTTVSRSHRRR